MGLANVRKEGSVADTHAVIPQTEMEAIRHELAERLKELEARGMNAHFNDVLGDIRSRDRRDSNREIAPLKPAGDAILLDTSDLDVEAAIARAIRLVGERLSLH